MRYRVVLTRRGQPAVDLGEMATREDAILLAGWKVAEYEQVGLPTGERVLSKKKELLDSWQLRLGGGFRAYLRIREIEEDGDTE